MKGLVTDIERCSTHDGPGLRTVVFLKGCPLSCIWCHNPESILPYPEELFYKEKCIGCGKCAEGCMCGARVTCGREMTDDEIFDIILEDRDYYGEKGGVTISGGEPLAQQEFTESILKKCRDAGISTAIETSMFTYNPVILSLCDTIMTDIKVFDSDIHKKAVGIDNIKILENITRASSLGIPIIVRTPVVPGINATKENVRNTRDFLKSLENIQKYELLPYHPLGLSKARALNKNMREFEVPTTELMKELKEYADLS